MPMPLPDNTLPMMTRRRAIRRHRNGRHVHGGQDPRGYGALGLPRSGLVQARPRTASPTFGRARTPPVLGAAVRYRACTRARHFWSERFTPRTGRLRLSSSEPVQAVDENAVPDECSSRTARAMREGPRASCAAPANRPAALEPVCQRGKTTGVAVLDAAMREHGAQALAHADVRPLALPKPPIRPADRSGTGMPRSTRSRSPHRGRS